MADNLNYWFQITNYCYIIICTFSHYLLAWIYILLKDWVNLFYCFLRVIKHLYLFCCEKKIKNKMMYNYPQKANANSYKYQRHINDITAKLSLTSLT